MKKLTVLATALLIAGCSGMPDYTYTGLKIEALTYLPEIVETSTEMYPQLYKCYGIDEFEAQKDLIEQTFSCLELEINEGDILSHSQSVAVLGDSVKYGVVQYMKLHEQDLDLNGVEDKLVQQCIALRKSSLKFSSFKPGG